MSSALQERSDTAVEFTDGYVPLEELLDATVRIGEPAPLVLGSRTFPDALKQLGSYDLLDQLGCGGMGIVFAARDRVSGHEFAVKILRPSLLMDPEAKVRFSREARAMAAIGHQRIVPVVRIGEDNGIPYIVMPLLRGQTLEDRLRKDVPLSFEEIIRIGTEIAEGLEAAHHHGLIHRDIKPANVWLEAPNESVCLLDFGLAREMSRESMLTDTGIVMGTPAYMSPEQARGEHLDPRSDLFSLGCILYQMTTGIRPFDGPTPINVLGQLETYNPPRVIARNPAVPSLLSNLIMELLAKNVKDRPPSAHDVAERLRRIPALQRSRSGPAVAVYHAQNDEPSDSQSVMPAESAAPGWWFWVALFMAGLSVVCWFAIQ